jgi:DNA-binding transcriptional LysR family regulator
MDVHTRDVRYFLAVAEEGNFSKAAERLFVSQPALSKQIRSLERDLRAQLFVRDRHGARLTAAGEELARHARSLLALWDEAQSAVAGTSGCSLVVGMHTSPGRNLLPRVQGLLREHCPDAAFQLKKMPWGDRTAGLADHAVDAAFVWLPLPRPPYRWITIARERRLVALPAEHRLADRDEVSLGELLDEPFLALPENAGELRDYWLAADQRGGVPARVTGIINDVDETYEAVTSGTGICFIAAGNAPIFERGGIRMPVVTDLSPSELVLAWHDSQQPPFLKTFADACAAVVHGDQVAAAGG